MKILSRINWTNALFLILTSLVGVVGTVYLIVTGHLYWQTVVLMVVLVVVTGLSVTAGYHRLFSHCSYRVVWPVKLLFLLIGAGAFEGSVIEWSTDHRRHHRYTDTDQDPYNIKRGFWHAHMGWLFVLDATTRDFSNVTDLLADPLVKMQHRFFVLLAIVMGFLLPLAITSLWHDPWGGLIIAGALRIVINQQMTFCINSVCHLLGKQTYSGEQSGRDNWMTALFTFGEGFHNFHHQFPIDYRNGVRFYDFDPTKWLIRTMTFLGLAKDIKQVSKEQIIRYRLRSDETEILGQAKQHSESVVHSVSHFIQPLRDRILKMAAYVHQLEKDYFALKRNRKTDSPHRLVTLRKRLKQAKLELRHSLIAWAELLRNYNKQKTYLVRHVT